MTNPSFDDHRYYARVQLRPYLDASSDGSLGHVRLDKPHAEASQRIVNEYWLGGEFRLWRGARLQPPG